MHGWRPRRILSAAVLLATLLPGMARAQAVVVPQAPAVWPGFWIVSSRNCPQSFCEGDPCCRLQYMYVGPDCRVQCVPEETFYAAMQPGVPICTVIHGSLVPWDGLLLEAPRVYRWLRCAAPERPLQVVFFSWDSDTCIGICPPLQFVALGRRAEYNGFYLAQMIQRLPAECPLSFFGHSHGARMVSAAMDLLGGGEIQGRKLTNNCGIGHRARAVFAAAAIDHHWLNPDERYELALTQLESLLNVQNETDIALHFYPLQRLFADEALGEEGFTSDDLQAIGWQSAKLATLDVTEMLGTGHTWYHFYTRPAIASAMVPWIYFDAPQPAVQWIPPPASAPPGAVYAPQ